MAPPTAYMLFCNENREAARQKLAAQGHEKCAVTVVAKELGQMWKALSDEERAAYKAKADEQLQQFREQKQQQQQADGDGGNAEQQDGEQQQAGAQDGDSKATAALPPSWIRKVVSADPDIKRCSGEALQALSAVADVFLAAVCAKATAAAAGAKRRTVRLDDVERCIRTDKRLVGAGMNAVLQMVTAAAATAGAAAGADEGKGAPPTKKPRVEKAAPATKNNISIERAFGLAQ